MIIKKEQRERLKEELHKAQGRAKARTLEVGQIFEAIEKAEAKLKSLEIPKKHWRGCRIYLEPAAVAKSYHGRPWGTRAVIERKVSGWDLKTVERTTCNKVPYGSCWGLHLDLSEEAWRAMPKLKL